MTELRLGMVGVGGWGKNLLRACSRVQGAQLAAICDADPRRLAGQACLYPGVHATTNYHDLLADPTLDAVILATPAPTHYQLALQALEAGKHVYVEKPMTLAGSEADALARRADALHRVLMVGHLLEYHPAIVWIRDYVRRGALGRPYYLYSQRLNLGTVRSDEHAGWSLAPHDVSVALFLLGSYPDWVAAHGESFLQPGIPDVVFAYLHFPNGVAAQLHVSWLDPHKARRLVLVGEQTMVAFDDMQPTEPIRVYDKGAEVATSETHSPTVTVRHGDVFLPCLPAVEPLQVECQHFVDAIREGRRPRSDGWDGVRVVRVLEAIDASLRAQGHPVEVASDDRPAVLRA
jgi:predicted dehydrogenase